MKNVSVSKIEFFFCLILAFSLGFCFNWSLNIVGIYNHNDDSMVFHEIINDSNLSMHVAVDHIIDDTIVMWVREQRPAPFVSESGLTASMTLSKVTLSCPGQSIVINEQRVFDSSMQYLATVKDAPIRESVIAFIIYSGLCEPDKTDVLTA